MKVENIAVICIAVTGIIVAGIAFIEVDILRQDFETINRPWIQISEWEKDKDLEFSYKNFGKIPNSDGKLIVHVSAQPIERKDFDNLAVTEQLPPLAPNAELRFRFNPEILATVKNACNSNEELFLGVLISYEYLNDKSGEYGEILTVHRFDENRCITVFVDAWIK